jgi:hypothetical protein
MTKEELEEIAHALTVLRFALAVSYSELGKGKGVEKSIRDRMSRLQYLEDRLREEAKNMSGNDEEA